jgi:iron complex outermembrane receptor protein
MERAALRQGLVAAIIGAGAGMTFNMPVSAQEQVAPGDAAQDGLADTAAEDGQGLGIITVTAQRVEGNLQRTPVSVALLSGDQLATRGIFDPAALQGALPAVQLQPIGDVIATIRGIGTFNLQPGADAAVAYNLDDTYIAHSTGLTPIFFDISRIEALRGPQGTLYGRNTNAGAINIITNKPEIGEMSAMGQLQVGNYGLIASEAVLNLPLGDYVAVRVSSATQDHSGYLHDGHNDADIRAARMHLLFAPEADLSLLLSADYSEQKGVGAGGSSPCPATFATAGCNQDNWDAYRGNETPVPDDFRHVTNTGLTANFEAGLGETVLTAIASWRRVEFASLTTTGDATVFFGDFGYAPSNTNELVTTELRLNSQAGAPLQWVVGAYYSHESLQNRIDRTFLANTLLGVSETVDRYRASSRAVFGQATLPVTDAFRLTAGLRFTDESKLAAGTATNYFVVPAASVATGGTESHSRLTWRLGAEADIAENWLAYATVSTGFKSGGVNQTPAGFGIPASYGPERITALQAGTKSRFLDDRLQINAEAFHYSYRGFQELLSSFAPGYLAFYTVNSERARLYGAEVELLARPSRNGRLDVSLALLNTRFTDFDLSAFGGADYSGNRLRNAPRRTINLGYEHRFDIEGSGSITARLESQLSSAFFTDTANTLAGRQGSYTQTGASLRYQSDEGPWSLTAWVRNLEDDPVLYSYFGGRGYPLAPRTFGLTFRIETD